MWKLAQGFAPDVICNLFTPNLHNKLKFVKVNYGYGQKQKWPNFDIHCSINNFNELAKID